METTLSNTEIKKAIKRRFQEAKASGLLYQIAQVARELGHDPASRDDHGNPSGYVSTHGPKYIWRRADVEVYVDDCGHYMTVQAHGQKVLSTHPTNEFIIHGPWVDLVLDSLEDAKERQQQREQQAYAGERQRLLARYAASM